MITLSFDVRGKPLAQARHWSAPETFGSRAKFNTASEPATLDLEVSFSSFLRDIPNKKDF